MPLKSKVYIETSVVSYLGAPPSRDVVALGRQEVTRRWWETRRDMFTLVISPVVVEEAGQGDPVQAKVRLNILAGMTIVEISPIARAVAAALLRGKALPPNAAVDALHIAIAGAHRADFLLTWNFRHIANAQMRGKIEATLRSFEIIPPLLCTPDQLQGDEA